MARWVPTFAGTTLLLLAAVQASHGQAQGGAVFYQGKTLRIVISTGVAGGFGEYARLLSEHHRQAYRRRPHVIVQSMPGAGGLLAANFLYASAPQDGTTIGIINSTVPFAPLFGSKGARFDTLKFNWLGTLDRAEGVCTLWHTSPVKTWADMLVKEFTVGSIGAGSEMELYPAMLNKLFGDQDQGDRRLQGRQRHRPRDGARRARRPLRHASHLVQGAASRLVRRAQDPVPVIIAERGVPISPTAPR